MTSIWLGVGEIAFYLGGALIYANRFPERWLMRSRKRTESTCAGDSKFVVSLPSSLRKAPSFNLLPTKSGPNGLPRSVSGAELLEDFVDQLSHAEGCHSQEDVPEIHLSDDDEQKTSRSSPELNREELRSQGLVERRIRGKHVWEPHSPFDYILNSHQIWHCCVLLAAWLHYEMMLQLWTYQVRYGDGLCRAGAGGVAHR